MRILMVLVALAATGILANTSQTTEPAVKYPALPEKVTSFGAAILDGRLYIYGGHTGRAHAYDRDAQGCTLRRLDLRNPKAWETMVEGPGLQGLALVADGAKLYRLGGFTAKNQKGEDQDLWSQADVASYDPDQNRWLDLSPMPEPRSSFDAAVLDHKIYAVGGWKLAGDADEQWHTKAWVLDVSAGNPQWQPIPDPPFQRRALAVAAFDGKVFVIGGMPREGEPSKRVDIYDPQTQQWSQGPTLQGEAMDGFGPAAFATGGRLYVSTYGGLLQRLADDGQSWQTVARLERARFFHRMLPLSDTQLILVGGASMEAGKFDQIDVVDVAQ
jgi:N-acetylneuraminic acid mutarotase